MAESLEDARQRVREREYNKYHNLFSNVTAHYRRTLNRPCAHDLTKEIGVLKKLSKSDMKYKHFMKNVLQGYVTQIPGFKDETISMKIICYIRQNYTLPPEDSKATNVMMTSPLGTDVTRATLKARMMAAGEKLLKAYDIYGGYGSSMAYAMATGETASIIEKYKFTIVALQIDPDGWDRIYGAKPETDSLSKIRNWLGKEVKQMLQNDLDQSEEIDVKYIKFKSIFPRMRLSFPDL